MSDEIPVLDVNAEDREAEALRYADEVRAWQAKRQAVKQVCAYEGCEEPVGPVGGECSFHAVPLELQDQCVDPTNPMCNCEWHRVPDFLQDRPVIVDIPLPEVITPERKFEWPCDRRDAHHPHIIDIDEVGKTVTACPGVAAHPATQMGGGYKEGEY